MKSVYSLLPEQASELAAQIDLLYVFLVAVSAVFAVLTAVLVLYFAIKYRRRSEDDVPEPPHADSRLEILCSVVLFMLVMVMFGWGASLYFKANQPPDDAIEILVVGKQWMWKIQHPQGKREINELHVPVGQTVKVTMTSEDVIHSFYIPAFRAKNDAVPGRYTSIWFKPTKIGKYRLFCAEYCGTEHSRMGGWVHVLSQADYERWLRGAVTLQETPAVAGSKLFTKFGCATCHNPASGALGPNLAGIYGKSVKIAGGGEVPVNDAYLRESILNPQAKIVEGFAPVMPVFKGLISEEQLMQIIAYIKSLTAPATGKEG